MYCRKGLWWPFVPARWYCQSIMTAFTQRYFPAIICGEYDSPIDALLGMHVAHDEAMDLVVAAWYGGAARSVLAFVDGGRAVAAVLLTNRRWAGCNVFPEMSCASCQEAERRLSRLAKRGKRGVVVAISTA